MTSLQEAGLGGPPRVVLDTNVVLDALLFGNAEVVPLWDDIRHRRVAWFASATMRAEFAYQLGRTSLQRYQPDSERMLTEFDRHARIVTEVPPIPPRAPVRLSCRDPEDQVFIDLAWHLRVDGLLTRDRDLLALARKARAVGLRILTPAAWPGTQPGAEPPR